MDNSRYLKRFASLTTLVVIATLGLGGTEARAQLFRGRGLFGGQYKVVVKERGYYPVPVVSYPYSATYVRSAPAVISQTQLIQPAPVVERRVYQPAPVVERRVYQPPPVVESRLIQPPPVVQTQLIQPAPVIEQRTYVRSYPY
jgi:hypothetical protein